MTERRPDRPKDRDFDLGVADDHAGDPPASERVHDPSGVTLPGAGDATAIDAPPDDPSGGEPVGGGPSGEEFGRDGREDAGPGFEPSV